MLPNIVSLEKAQQTHNKVISAIGNNSPSNDFTQHKHDLNDRLIATADAFAAGNKLGMSEEETLAAMSRMLRTQQRKDDSVTMNDIERQMVQSANSLAEVSTGAELKGVGYREMPEVDPFGQDQGQYYSYGPDDMQYEEQETARMRERMGDMEDMSSGSRRFDRGGQVILKSGENPAEYDDMAADLERMADSRVRDAVAPQSVLADALSGLQAAKQQQSGFKGALARVFGDGGSAAVEGRLEEYLDPKVGREAEASLVAEMARRDRDKMNYRRGAYNNIKGQIQAEQIGEDLYRRSSIYPGIELPAEKGDKNLSAIGGGMSAYPAALQALGGPAVDPSGLGPLGTYGPEYSAPVVDPTAVQQAMSPRAWMVDKQPEFSDGGRSFGNYPQVDVTGATSLFAERLRQVPGFENVSPNIRGIDEIERVVDMATRGGNVNFSTREPVTDAQGKTKLKSMKQQTPDVRGLLSALRYTPAQEAQLANAMYQLEVAKATEVNQQGKQQYYTRTGPNGQLEPTGFGGTTPGGASVFFNSPEAIDPREGQAQVARINPGQTIEGRDIKTALGRLGNSDAAMPFIGAVSETDPATGKTTLETQAGPGYKTRYNTTGADDIIGIERALRSKEAEFQRNRAKKSRGRIEPVNEDALRGKVVKAALVSERDKRDTAKRADQMSSIISNLPPNALRTRIR